MEPFSVVKIIEEFKVNYYSMNKRKVKHIAIYLNGIKIKICNSVLFHSFMC